MQILLYMHFMCTRRKISNMCAAIDIVGDAHLNYLSVIIQTISGIENFMVREKNLSCVLYVTKNWIHY